MKHPTVSDFIKLKFFFINNDPKNKIKHLVKIYIFIVSASDNRLVT